VSGGPFRLIHGGRSDEPSPGLLIVGASEVVTVAGGVRMGPAQGEVATIAPGGGARMAGGEVSAQPASPTMPAIPATARHVFSVIPHLPSLASRAGAA